MTKRKSKPIYVEIGMASDMDTLWSHTQNPDLHVQWDLRFTDILYLPRRASEPVQRFLYRTRIGFGLAIAGTGETKAHQQLDEHTRLSTLKFGSEQRLSLIREGGGYWRYEAAEGGELTFSTQYDYETRFGALGTSFDRLIFRPLFGWATAWSFDLLRIWLEDHLPPKVTIRLALVHYIAVLVLASLWLYEGLVPKMIWPEGGELAMLQGVWPGAGKWVLSCIGAGEMLVGAAALVWHRKAWVYGGQLVLLLLLTLSSAPRIEEWIGAPFNPLTLCLPMLGLCLIAKLTMERLPDARRCRRAAPKKGRD
ncbi:DoxX-like family protein [Paenibacillus sp. GCM10023252]|uniref:DoxX-like family protein n=1 Tax=Paenibacillus sp. GCM10023252 TaxID=3252649 RepID=UPI00361BDD10